MNMRHFSFIILLLVFVSCKNKSKPPIDYTGFVDRQVVLDSGLGTISFKLPARFDTFNHWIDWSDCFPCGWTYYRFADKKYSFRDYDSRFKTEDSVFQFTIRHKYYNTIPDSFYADEKNWFDTVKTLYVDLRKVHYDDTLLSVEPEIINGRKTLTSIFYQDSDYQNMFGNRLYVHAITILPKRYVEFYFQCDNKDTSSFLLNARKTIQSIQIKE